jgi:hypothetical protein
MAGALRRAAEEAGIELPGHVSLPLSFTTAEAPSESVAVLSGSARGRVRDAEFAAGDTDASLGKRLAAEAAAQKAAPAAARAAVPARPPARPAAPRAPAERGTRPPSILNAVGMLVVFNLVAVLLGLVTGRWGIFGRGWPFEVLLVGLLLNEIMYSSGSIWLLIPTAIVLGNGFLFSFYAITNAWRLWAFLWPLEPLLVVGTIWYTIHMSGQGDRAHQVSRRLAQAVKRPVIIVLILVVVLGALFGS